MTHVEKQALIARRDPKNVIATTAITPMKFD
jgi:hypothetical protein